MFSPCQNKNQQQKTTEKVKFMTVIKMNKENV